MNVQMSEDATDSANDMQRNLSWRFECFICHITLQRALNNCEWLWHSFQPQRTIFRSTQTKHRCLMTYTRAMAFVAAIVRPSCFCKSYLSTKSNDELAVINSMRTPLLHTR
eukprot:scaffold187789_cov37-Prasinocladus_malaysianus.AAC.1